MGFRVSYSDTKKLSVIHFLLQIRGSGLLRQHKATVIFLLSNLKIWPFAKQFLPVVRLLGFLFACLRQQRATVIAQRTRATEAGRTMYNHTEKFVQAGIPHV